MASAGLQQGQGAKLKLPQFNSIQEEVQISGVPKVVILPIVANYHLYGGYPMQYPLTQGVSQPLPIRSQPLQPQPLRPQYPLFAGRKRKRSP